MPLVLGGHLITSGGALPALVDDSLRRQVVAGGAIDTALYENGLAISEDELLSLMARSSGLKTAGAVELAHADREVAKLLPARLAERHCVLPLRAEGRTLHVAVTYPANVQMLEEIGFLLGRDLVPTLAVEVRLLEAICRIYGVRMPVRHEAVLAMLGPSEGGPESPPVDPPAEETPIPLEEPKRLPDSLSEGERPADEDLASALVRAIEEAESNPKLFEARPEEPGPRPRRDRVDVKELARKIVVAAGREPPPDFEPLEQWTLGKAKAALDRAENRHQIIRVALRFALKTFDFAAAFAVVGGNAVGWTAMTKEGIVDDRVERLSIPLDAPSVLRTVILARGRYLGPIPADGLSQSLVADMGRQNPNAAFVYPVEVRDRPVAILYGDTVGRPVSDRRVGELVLFAQHLGRRFERLILEQKNRMGAPTPQAVDVEAHDEAFSSAPTPTPTPVPVPVPIPASAKPLPPAPPVPSPPVRPAPAWQKAAFDLEPPVLTSTELFQRSPPRKPSETTIPGFEQPLATPTSAAGMSRMSFGLQPTPAPVLAPAPAPLAQPMPSMDEVFSAADRLLGNDTAERARALAALSRVPELGAAVLVARFPGPLLRGRLPVVDLPLAEELGPIPAALVRMGQPAAKALAPLLDHRDVDTRYFALLTVGRLPSPQLVAAVAARVFDHHPLVANAARVAFVAMKDQEGFGEAVTRIRNGLNGHDSEASGQAARALGLVHDVESVERLIELSGSENRVLAQAAAAALREICRQDFGPGRPRWEAWWEKNRERPRAAWLIDALNHKERDLRASAIEELSRAINDNLGYFADGAKTDRDRAQERWRELLERQEKQPEPAPT